MPQEPEKSNCFNRKNVTIQTGKKQPFQPEKCECLNRKKIRRCAGITGLIPDLVPEPGWRGELRYE
jgi:hypothetical protein